MKKLSRYILALLVVGIVGYKSVYFQKLSETRKSTGAAFDAPAFSRQLWEEKFPARLDSAVALTELIKAAEADPTAAFARYSNAMGIGNYRYCLVKVTGTAVIINEDDIVLHIPHADSLMNMQLATEYIYGNAIRDASALIDIKDFPNTSDLNSISEELNKTVRTAVLPPFKKQVKAGDNVEVIAAVELNKEHIRFNHLELIPVRLKILP